MWSKPWSYKEGLVIGAGLLVIGILLQMAVGAINWSLFACPVNVIVLMVFAQTYPPLFLHNINFFISHGCTS